MTHRSPPSNTSLYTQHLVSTLNTYVPSHGHRPRALPRAHSIVHESLPLDFLTIQYMHPGSAPDLGNEPDPGQIRYSYTSLSEGCDEPPRNLAWIHPRPFGAKSLRIPALSQRTGGNLVWLEKPQLGENPCSLALAKTFEGGRIRTREGIPGWKHSQTS